MTIIATIPSTFQSDREDVHSLVIAIADAWIAYCQTNGIAQGIVRERWHTLPESLTGDGPFVYVSEITEQITHDMNTRETIFEGGLGYVDIRSDPEETDARVNAFADYMRDVFTANVQTIQLATGRSGVFEEVRAANVPPLHESQVYLEHFMVNWEYTVSGGYR